ncbi:MAG: gamma-glutamylcyclotransferase, partial [Propioniciclava sp.]
MTATTAAPDTAVRIPWWTKGDLNGFFGLGTNVLLNVLVITSLSLYVVGLDPAIVYGRILPALGIALPLGNIWYAILARRLAIRQNRTDVTALPYGPSVPHMFFVVFVVMLPTLIASGDPLKAWRAGLAWALIVGLIVCIGALMGPALRRYVPRAALLGALAGISITFISMRPAAQIWEVPWIGLVSLGFILVGWVGTQKMPFGLPVGLVAVIVATAVAWIAVLAGWSGILTTSGVAEAAAGMAIHLPVPGAEVIAGMADIAPLLASAIPLGVFNFAEGMTNVESAAAAGDRFSMRQILLADGLGAIVGSFLGSPFPPAVYIGHPGWKKVGGRIGYSLATGVVVGLVCFTGTAALLLAVIPMQALVPILLFIGLVIGAQAFSSSPTRYAPAIVLAMIPSIAEWAAGLIENTLATAGSSVAEAGMDQLSANGVLYEGLKLLGSGGVLMGILLGAIAVFIIDRRLVAATISAVVMAGLSAFGFINAPEIHWPSALEPVTLGYLLLAVVLGGFAWAEARSGGAPDIDSGLLFVSGSLLPGGTEHELLEGAEMLESARTGTGYTSDPAYPAITADETASEVDGELYAVTSDVLVRVLEGLPAGTRRAAVTLADGR